MRTRIVISIAVTAVILAASLATWWFLSREPVLRVAEILARYDEGRQCGAATIHYPFPDAVFPPDIAAPTVRWENTDQQADAWVVKIEFPDGNEPLAFESQSPEWTPAEEDWSKIKKRSRAQAGRHAKAARTGRQSLDVAGRNGNRQFIRAMEPMIQSYEQKAGRSLP
jgi:hypothetical protein